MNSRFISSKLPQIFFSIPEYLFYLVGIESGLLMIHHYILQQNKFFLLHVHISRCPFGYLYATNVPPTLQLQLLVPLLYCTPCHI